jgi:diguanylate cyclase (GGDEF)-like protein
MAPSVKNGFSLGWLALSCVLSGSIPVHSQEAAIPDIDRAEALSWLDSSVALQMLDRLAPTAQKGRAQIQWLMVRGLAYADTKNEHDAQPVVLRLREIGRSDAAAEAASHLVEGWLLQQDQLDRMDRELKLIGSPQTLPDFEQFRLDIERAYVLHASRHEEAALSSLEQALDLAYAMHSPPRAIEARLKMLSLFIHVGDLDRAAGQLAPARDLAEKSDDAHALVEISLQESNLAIRRKDYAGQLRALLDAWARAQRTGSDRLQWEVSLDLGNYFLQTGDYAESLRYSKQSLPFAQRLQRMGNEEDARLNIGEALIGLGQLKKGKEEAEGALQWFLTNGNRNVAEQMMREYQGTLERAGDLAGALEVFHRDDELREQLATQTREKALLELSAKFDAERRTRQIELLERDNAIKSRDLRTQQLRQKMIAMAAGLIALTCGALAWGISRIRRINARLLYSTQHDALTGLLNRRYFDEHILSRHRDRPYLGCLLLLDLDHYKRINDTLGHAAGNAVLAEVGRRLSATLSDDDAVVYWGAEEFLAILGPMSQAELSVTAQRLLQAVRGEPVVYCDDKVSCTASIGGASFPLSGAAIDVRLDRAITLVDNALAQAKRRGRDRACLITGVEADSDEELTSINVAFEEATAQFRVHMVESGA